VREPGGGESIGRGTAWGTQRIAFLLISADMLQALCSKLFNLGRRVTRADKNVSALQEYRSADLAPMQQK